MSKADAILEVIEYTDPYCTWCWGSEPIIKKIREVYGDQVKIGYKMGGLVADINQFYDASNDIGGPEWYRQVAEHWLDASNRHGMPVDEQVFYDIKDDMFSTYPANIAYKAAEFQDVELAKKFLRRMREGAAARREAIQRIEVQADLADEVGLDITQFLDDIKSGRAEEAFYKDLNEARSRGISGFPTFLIRNREGQEAILYGYQRFESFRAAFQKLAENELKPRVIEASDDNILAFVHKYKKVAPREIAETFDLPQESAIERLTKLKDKGLLREQEVGNGSFFSA